MEQRLMDVPTVTTADGVSVKRYDRSHIAGSLAAIPAAIDNQWAPRSILEDIVATGATPSEWLGRRDQQARAEFMRSLIDNERIIVNRAYLFNSSAVRSQYLSDSDSTKYFRMLFENETILVNLMNEESPTQFPNFPIEDADRVRKSWTDLCQSASNIPLVRMSWNDQQNKIDFEKFLYKPFIERLLKLPAMNAKEACHDLGIAADESAYLKKNIADLSSFINEKLLRDEIISRNDIYSNFIVQRGSNVAERHFCGDRMKLAIKEFADLAYNINASEALGVISSSPKETLNRSALQEFDDEKPEGDDMDPEELARCFRQFAFDVLHSSYKIPQLDLLTSKDIYEIRNTGAHHDYLQKLNSFMITARSDFGGSLQKSSSSGTTAQELLQAYEQVVRRVEDRSRDRRYDHIEEEWISNLTFRIETSGISLEFDTNAGALKVDGGALLENLNRTVPYVVKCVIGSRKFMDQSLGSAFELFRGYLSRPGEQLTMLQRKIIENAEINLETDETMINEAASSRSDDKTREKMNAY